MKLYQRILYILTGLCIGTVFALFILNKKNVTFDYGPNARTLKSIRTKPEIIISENAEFNAIKVKLDSVALAYVLNKGDVDFSKSQPRTKPCQKYWIDASIYDQDIAVIIKRCDSTATVEEVIIK